MANNTKKTTGASGTKKTTSTKTTKAKQSSSSKSSKKKVPTAFVIILAILFGIWFFGGKPTIVFTPDGVSIGLTEDPIIKHIPEFIAGEYPPKVQKEEDPAPAVPVKTAETPSQPAAETPAAAESQTKQTITPKTASKAGNGTTGSNPKLDQGNAENTPLYFGNPSDAVADTKYETNYLMVKPQYTLSYNNETLCPNWAAWHLSKDDIGSADRSNDFRPDEELPEGWYAVKKADYNYNVYGFDRGHVCPSADRTLTQNDNSMTFLMTNMVPQSPDNNRVVWNHFEAYERQLALDGNEIYIIAGPYGTGGTGAKGKFDTVDFTDKKTKKSYKMNVPASTWKVILVIPYGDNDLSRVDENAITIAINVPNDMGIAKNGDWEQYLTSIDAIEEMTGYDFFELLPDDVEAKLESRIYTK